MMQQILLADDNSESRSALRLMLHTHLGIQSMTEARDMEHVWAIVEDAPPDCVILDWELPGRPARGRVSVLKLLAPKLKIIAISARPEASQEAWLEEVDAFISKTEPPDQMIETIREILAASDNKISDQTTGGQYE